MPECLEDDSGNQGRCSVGFGEGIGGDLGGAAEAARVDGADLTGGLPGATTRGPECDAVDDQPAADASQVQAEEGGRQGDPESSGGFRRLRGCHRRGGPQGQRGLHRHRECQWPEGFQRGVLVNDSGLGQSHSQGGSDDAAPQPHGGSIVRKSSGSGVTMHDGNSLDVVFEGPSNNLGDVEPEGPHKRPIRNAPPRRREPRPRRLDEAQGRLGGATGNARGEPAAAAAVPAEGAQGRWRGRDGEELEYVMPWERPPSWLYPPHLHYVGTVYGGSYGEGRTEERITDAGSIGPAPRCGGGATGPIRGRRRSPGTRSEAQPQSDGSRPGGSPATIRGPDKGLGTGGDALRNRAQARLDARNAHLQVSLAQHAERVHRRRERDPPTGNLPTVSERMAALRRRISARAADAQGASNEIVQDGKDDAARCEVGGGCDGKPTQREAEPSATEFTAEAPSKEDVKMHYSIDLVGTAEGDAALGSAASVNADTAAAARVEAWHSGAGSSSEGGAR